MAAAAEATYQILTPGIAELRDTKGELVKEPLELPQQIASEPPSSQCVPDFTFIVGSSLPSARLDRVLLGVLKDPDYRLRRPIPLDLTTEESEVVLTWAEIDEFGCGSTMSAAVDDFGQTLRELHRHLSAADVNLGADLQRVRQVLSEYIEPRTK